VESHSIFELTGDGVNTTDLNQFRSVLRSWFEPGARPMPWRETQDPYLIWISEVILQQTRVEQGLPYYHAFVRLFPDVSTLADAHIDTLLKAWEGLGYYSRARNLHRAARIIVEQHDGLIPSKQADLLSLPGIGPYTAAAILSIAFNRPFAVLDGNVIRVLSRLAAFGADVSRSSSRTYLQRLADHLLDRENPGNHNEALMDLGATVCLPTLPDCPSCPLQPWCRAGLSGHALDYPVKRKKSRVPHYDVSIGVIGDDRGQYLVQRRAESGMLGGLWEFPGGKVETDESLQDACKREFLEELNVTVEVGEKIATINHAYSHFRVTLHAFSCSILGGTPRSTADLPLEWVLAERLESYAVPRANRKLIDILRNQSPN